MRLIPTTTIRKILDKSEELLEGGTLDGFEEIKVKAVSDTCYELLSYGENYDELKKMFAYILGDKDNTDLYIDFEKDE